MLKKLNESFLFFYSPKGLIAADTKDQKYFLINSICLDRVVEWIKNPSSTVYNEILDNDLVKSGLLIDAHEETNFSDWGGDQLSWYFFNVIRNRNKDVPFIDKENFINKYLEMSQKVSLPTHRHENIYGSQPISLPSPKTVDLHKTSLLESLKYRKTSRSFSKYPLDIDALSTILFASFGYIHGKIWDDFHNAHSSLKRTTRF